MSRTTVVSRFFLISAAFGLIVGVFEASLLWTTPRIIPLLTPDVGWVIWFLAPLVDMALFGIPGLSVGLLSVLSDRKEVFVTIQIGFVAIFITLMLGWFHLEIGLHPFRFDEEVLFPLLTFALGFGVSLVLLVVIWRRLADFGERWIALRLQGWSLAAITLVAVVGIGVFAVQPSFSATSAQAAPPPSDAPNIVFITLDTVRADHLSAYGYDRPTTPHLDRFARTG